MHQLKEQSLTKNVPFSSFPHTKYRNPIDCTLPWKYVRNTYRRKSCQEHCHLVYANILAQGCLDQNTGLKKGLPANCHFIFFFNFYLILNVSKFSETDVNEFQILVTELGGGTFYYNCQFFKQVVTPLWYQPLQWVPTKNLYVSDCGSRTTLYTLIWCLSLFQLGMTLTLINNLFITEVLKIHYEHDKLELPLCSN